MVFLQLYGRIAIRPYMLHTPIHDARNPQPITIHKLGNEVNYLRKILTSKSK
jgi:hypothetical protein